MRYGTFRSATFSDDVNYLLLSLYAIVLVMAFIYRRYRKRNFFPILSRVCLAFLFLSYTAPYLAQLALTFVYRISPAGELNTNFILVFAVQWFLMIVAGFTFFIMFLVLLVKIHSQPKIRFADGENILDDVLTEP